MKSLALLAAFSAVSCFAQQQAPASTPPAENSAQVTSPENLTSAAGEFFNHDFFNFFAFTDLVHDSNLSTFGGGQSGAWGYDIGGGVTGYHQFETGTLSLSYRGDYRSYGGANSSGTDQSLAFSYTQRLNQRWSMSVNASGGIYLFGANYYSYGNEGPTTPITNPLSTETRFLQSGLSVTYQQSRRLAYTVSGNFFLTRYNYSQAFGSTGGSGTVSANYRLDRRNNVGATYSHTAFYYQQNAGSAQIDTVFVTYSHVFSNRTTLDLSGGVSRTHAQGTITEPVTVVVAGQTLSGFVGGAYNQIAYVPSFQGTLARNWRRFEFSVSAGQTVSPGNGVYLTSKDAFVSGSVSRSWRRSNFSAGGGFFHIISLANTVSGSYTSGSFAASYGYNIVRYLSAHVAYSYYRNGSFGTFTSNNDSRFTIGLSVSSKSVPLTLF